MSNLVNTYYEVGSGKNSNGSGLGSLKVTDPSGSGTIILNVTSGNTAGTVPFSML